MAKPALQVRSGPQAFKIFLNVSPFAFAPAVPSPAGRALPVLPAGIISAFLDLAQKSGVL